MKYIFICLLLTSAGLSAQELKFDKRFVECENKWVAFQEDKDSTHIFGFIYIDAQAGLTLNYEGSFRIDATGKYIPRRLDSTSMKVRLQPNRVKVAIIPASRYNELGITDPPDWLHFYQEDTGSIERLYRWGFLYNEWGMSEKALTYLERAWNIDPKFKGLDLELAFAYNALEKYDKAVTVLETALKNSTSYCYLYKELSYSQMHLGQLDKAGVTAKKGIGLCNDKLIQSEMAYNMAYQYSRKKDKKNFTAWADETKKWATLGDQFMQALASLEEKMK